MADETLPSVVEALKSSLPDFTLFFDTHFEIVAEDNLRPTFGGSGSVKFPKNYLIRRKLLSREEKETYYENDLNLWESMIYVGEKKGV